MFPIDTFQQKTLFWLLGKLNAKFELTICKKNTNSEAGELKIDITWESSKLKICPITIPSFFSGVRKSKRK